MPELSQKSADVASMFSCNLVQSEREKAPVVGTARSPSGGDEYRYVSVTKALCQSSLKVDRSLSAKRSKTQVPALLSPCTRRLGAVSPV